MRQEEIEAAIHVLSNLLNGSTVGEEYFQEFFESFPCVFETFRYLKSYPKPRLPLPDHEEGEYLEPDFLVERADGLFDVLDLKTPDEKLIHGRLHREHFYAKIDEYISQVTNYSRYFDDHNNREVVKNKLGIDVQPNPDVIIVAGRDDVIDKRQLHRELRERNRRLSIWTFDDVLTALKLHYAHTFSGGDDLPGYSVYAVMQVEPGGDSCVSRCVMDSGRSADRDRITIYLSGRKVSFELRDTSTELYRIEALIPEELLTDSRPMLLSCYFAQGDQTSFLQLRFDNRVVASADIPKSVHLNADMDSSRVTMGIDITGKCSTGTSFGLYELMNYSKVHLITERMQLIEYVERRIVDDDYKSYVSYIEGAGLVKAGGDLTLPQFATNAPIYRVRQN